MRRYVVLAVLVVGILAGCTSMTQDQRYSNEILGSWIVAADSSDNYSPIPIRETFFRNGTYKVYVFSDASCSHVIDEDDLTWKIKNGILYSKLVKTSANSLLHVGKTMKDQIISIGKTRMVLHSLDDGTTYSRTRSSGCLAKPAKPVSP